MTTPAHKDFVSIGSLACHLQRSVRDVAATAAALQIAPALRLNGVVHFAALQTEKIIQAIHMRDRHSNVIANRAAGLRN